MSIFDEIVPRRGSGSYKWDSSADAGMVPLWVADMDFKAAPVILDALRRRVEHGVFGYTLVDDGYYDALTRWFKERHGYEFKRENVIYTSGVVPAISAIIKSLTTPGDGVIVQTPVYNCFFSSIRNNGCRVVENPLVKVPLAGDEFTYKMDFDGLEEVASEHDVKVMLLCNPHNPAGRAWTREELDKVADICRRHGVRVVSDEIHCELAMPGYHYIPYGNLDKNAIVCVSPSKGFNIAGLQIANIVCPDAETRAIVDRAINVNEVCDVNPFGVAALKAAYSDAGAQWLDELRQYLWQNYIFARDYLKSRLPGCPMAKLEATYLLWLDISPLGIPSAELEERLKEQAKVWVNCGEMYGEDGYIRLNVACPRSLLADGLERLADYLSKCECR
ncbi:MalY/PatB family protein [uncultured Muribaculum sp.]|uniref:MalY/PatB family protein n=1 Tax=uncultured Muribaculum sp. TaxID=1918613 RepID=UPI002594B65A|nr:MalY/PatB family protein [uncultured Muribaculum sp.]